MAGSNITKHSLASSLKELMNEMPFSKITVSDICGRCGMSRKSFYYHFKDKYDLVNWIFDTEFVAVAEKREYANSWQFFEEMCHYLDSERRFYSRAMKITGQNSFSDHFMELMQPIVAEHLKKIFGENMSKYHVQFFSDALVMAIKRWIMDLHDLDADAFIGLIRSTITATVNNAHLVWDEQ